MSQISFFNNHHAKTPASSTSISQLLENIKNGKWQSQVEHLRSISDPEAKKKAKVGLPGVTISGTFSKRNADSLLTHSGFICIDIDLETDRNQLINDPYTYALFDSVSKRGVALLVKINPSKHNDSFNFLQKYYHEAHGINIDGAPRSTVSLRCVTYDPLLFHNPDSALSKTYVPKKPKNTSLPYVLSDDQVGQVIHEVISSGRDIAPDYDSYVQLAFAIASGLGESGRDAFHSMCSLNDKYKFSQADKKYTSVLKVPNPRITIGTFFHMAKQAGIELPKQDSKPINIAAMGKKSGRTKEAVVEQLVTINHLSPAHASNIATQVFAREDITLKTLASDPEHLIESLIQFISINYRLRRNLITQKIEIVTNSDGGYSPRSMTDEDINDIYLHSRASFNTPQINKDLIQSIIFSSNTPSYNPMLEFIASNKKTHPPSDTGHIDKLISAVDAHSPYHKSYIRKWIIAIQAAIDFNPVRLMLVFTGPQYNGKTEFFRRLLPSELKPYYAESKLDRGKDDELLMCQNLMVMDDEMGGKSKQDEKRLKELTSKEYFSLRAPYRRDNIHYRRLAILCGTSNVMEIMNDPTGNTRILPVMVNFINYNILNSVDRTALFMEAYHAYASGESWQLNKEEADALGHLSDDFSSITFERELILKFFEPGTTDYLTATEIKNDIEVNTKQQIKNMTRFGIELRKIFGNPKSVKRGKMPVKCYPTKRINQDSSNHTSNYENTQNTDDEPLPF